MAALSLSFANVSPQRGHRSRVWQGVRHSHRAAVAFSFNAARNGQVDPARITQAVSCSLENQG